jgi:hypothetical protein
VRKALGNVRPTIYVFTATYPQHNVAAVLVDHQFRRICMPPSAEWENYKFVLLKARFKQPWPRHSA